MTYNPQKHHRQSIRLRNYDYTSSGAYFITIGTQQPQDTLSIIQDNTTQSTEIGQIIQNTWNDLPNHYNIQTDEFIIMPDHIHGIIIINPNTITPPNTTQNVGALQAAPQIATQPDQTNTHDSIAINPAGNERQGAASSAPTNTDMTNNTDIMVNAGVTTHVVKHAALSEIVRGFKSMSAVAVNKSLGRSGVALWQRNYYERIVRDDLELQRVREYILWNPARWLEKRDGLVVLDARAGAKT